MANTKQQREKAKTEKLGLFSIMVDGKYIKKDKIEINGCCSEAKFKKIFDFVLSMMRDKEF